MSGTSACTQPCSAPETRTRQPLTDERCQAPNVYGQVEVVGLLWVQSPVAALGEHLMYACIVVVGGGWVAVGEGWCVYVWWW